MNQINRRSSMYSPERSQKDSYYRSRDRESYSPHFDKKSKKKNKRDKSKKKKSKKQKKRYSSKYREKEEEHSPINDLRPKNSRFSNYKLAHLDQSELTLPILYSQNSFYYKQVY